MIQIKFKNLEKSEMAREAAQERIETLDNVRKRASPKGLPTRPLCVMRFRSWK